MPSNGGAKLNYGPIHNNSNLTCAIEIRVGGLDPLRSDLLEVAFLPVDCKYNLHTQFVPFHLRMRPSWRVDNKVAKINQQDLDEYHHKASHDSVDGSGLFSRWVDDTLFLKNHKKIIPLTFDWSRVKPYLVNWLGETTYEHYISDNHRDLLSVLNFVNDRADFWGDEVLFKHPTRGMLFNKLAVELIEDKDIPSIAKGYIDAYKRMIGGYISGFARK